MILKIREIRTTTDINKECVVLEVVSKGNIKGHVLALDIFEHSRVTSNNMRHFVFPDQEVNIGDFVVVSTRYGHTSKQQNKDGSITYFYFWNLHYLICSRQNTVILLQTLETQK